MDYIILLKYFYFKIFDSYYSKSPFCHTSHSMVDVIGSFTHSSQSMHTLVSFLQPELDFVI